MHHAFVPIINMCSVSRGRGRIGPVHANYWNTTFYLNINCNLLFIYCIPSAVRSFPSAVFQLSEQKTIKNINTPFNCGAAKHRCIMYSRDVCPAKHGQTNTTRVLLNWLPPFAVSLESPPPQIIIFVILSFVIKSKHNDKHEEYAWSLWLFCAVQSTILIFLGELYGI